ncbi:MAG: putative 116 kDa U5 small nuclear ribonucleoprotein component, partial [Streblomastix strix]
FAKAEVKVSDPYVPLNESVAEKSILPCSAETANKIGSFAVIAESLEKGISSDIEAGRVRMMTNEEKDQEMEKDKEKKKDMEILGQKLQPTQALFNAHFLTTLSVEYLQKAYSYDTLAAKTVWAFGPEEEKGSNILINDTLPYLLTTAASSQSVYTSSSLYSAQSSSTSYDFNVRQSPTEILMQQIEQINKIQTAVSQGFRWACREGPLCSEPLRDVKFRLIKADINQQQQINQQGSRNIGQQRGIGVGGDTNRVNLNMLNTQIVPAVRRACCGSLLLSQPRVLEPILWGTITCPADCVEPAYSVLGKRRGHVLAERPLPGSPLFAVDLYIPSLESFGFETDLRAHT